MAVVKSKRNVSRDEFNATTYRVHDDAVDMIENNFRAKPEMAEKHKDYIASAARELKALVWDLVYYIKVANALYPTTREELVERRLNQDKAIGVCFDILTLYELTMKKLKVQDDKGVSEIKNLNHQINSLKAWRTSDNKRFKNLME